MTTGARSIIHFIEWKGGRLSMCGIVPKVTAMRRGDVTCQRCLHRIKNQLAVRAK